MSRLTTSEIIAQGHYLEPTFDPATLTIPHLVGILSWHDVKFPSQHNKAKLVEIFNKDIKGRSAHLKEQRLNRSETAASEEGILDGVSGLPLVPEKPASVRRSSRRLSREPSVEPTPPNPPKRRRSSAQPSLGHGQPTSRKSKLVQPVVEEESEPEEEQAPVRKAGRSDSAESASRRISQKFGPGTEDSGWEDNNIFQSGGESSPVRSPKPKTPRKSGTRNPRTSLSAPPELDSPPPQLSPYQDYMVPINSSPPQSKFEPLLPPKSSETYDDNSGYADVSADLSGEVFEEEEEQANTEEDDEQDFSVDDSIEDPQNVEVARRIAKGGTLVRRSTITPSRPTPLWQKFLFSIIVLSASGIVGQFKMESAPLGYCDTGKNTNQALVELEASRREIEGCHAQRSGDDDPDLCPPLPLVPLPHPTACTPCPIHATCTRTTVMCDNGFLLSPHPLALVPYLSDIADGLPGLGPIAFPPKCVEDPARKINIGALGKGIDSLLAIEHGKRLCAGVNQNNPIDGGDARRWGFDARKLRDDMKRKAPICPLTTRFKLRLRDNFDGLFDEAVQQLSEWGRLITGTDTDGNHYLATEHVEMGWNCRLTVAARDAWLEWRRSIFGTLAIVIAGLLGRSRMAVRQIEDRRVADLVQIALDTLRNQELAYHTDPVSTPQPYLSSLQLRDLVLQDEHSVPARRKLWERVERVVEGNANVRANLEEMHGGDEARVWRWVGSNTSGRRVTFNGEGADGRIVA
ncbi:hypothetical protein BD410DRAFT_713668 [Rickenella mellea]|uniref:Man1/Src1 C-terminal domain-containing protein n=1 Tax=Rickenella mellea TaxID=50990 RepID=A0A4Y7QJK4_9AGAM|nr:hypothetical protein BD410DRAFT_713668 [Rickenella mellea]